MTFSIDACPDKKLDTSFKAMRHAFGIGNLYTPYPGPSAFSKK